MHLPTREELQSLPEPTPSQPLRILLSGCLAGRPCGVDGTSYGEWSLLQKLAQAPNARLIAFCPEDFSFGTPRELRNIHGGDGFDVLDERDFRSRGCLLQRLDPGHVPDAQAVDHHETPWYREYFGGTR